MGYTHTCNHCGTVLDDDTDRVITMGNDVPCSVCGTGFTDDMMDAQLEKKPMP